MQTITKVGVAGVMVAFAGIALAQTPPRILVNHLGYEASGSKQAVIEETGHEALGPCAVRSVPDGKVAAQVRPGNAVTVDHWHAWHFRTIDFSEVSEPGKYFVECAGGTGSSSAVVRSYSFRIQRNVLERHTIAYVLAYFKASRVSGANERADERIGFLDDPGKAPIDAGGGWYDATGDYGVHLSQLSYTSWFNSQQVPLVAYALGRTYELLKARDDVNFTQIERHLIDGATWGADFLVRMHPKGGSFYGSICAPGPGKRPQDRRICPAQTAFALKKTRDSVGDIQTDSRQYEASFRSGGGFAIAALALAARLPEDPRYGQFSNATYLDVAESAFAWLEQNDARLVNDGKENILDDYSALLAATELLRTTREPKYAAAAQHRADSLMARLASDRQFKDWWRRGDAGSGPFYSASDAGAPVVALLDYYPLADAATRARIKDAIRRSLGFELAITDNVANPFGYARMYVETNATGRRAQFFFPHDSRAAPWWQGDNARIASLATAVRLALPLFPDDHAFQSRLRAYATHQLNWILGLNPYDSSMMQGVGHGNTEYLFFCTWQYEHLPGGIVNGITGAFDSASGDGIDYDLPIAVTHGDDSWRWNEQWLPHAAWYLLAVAARDVEPATRAAAPPARAGSEARPVH